MQKKIPEWIWGLFISLVLFLLLFPLILIYYTNAYRSGWIGVISLPAVIKTIAFLAGYSLLRPLNTLRFWKFMVYIISMAGINAFLFSLSDFQWSFIDIDDYFLFFYYVLPFVVSTGLGFGLLKYLFNIPNRQAISLGILLGFLNAQTFLINLPMCR